MTSAKIRALHDDYILDTYRKFPVVIDHGKGARLWDPEGNEYLDLTSGIGVSALGQADSRWISAIRVQLEKLGHVSNLFYTEPPVRLAEILCGRTGMSGVFFTNSGAEANEAMIKLARKYSRDKYGLGRHVIVTLRRSFHGRTMATLSASGQDILHRDFDPFLEGFRHVEVGDLQSLREMDGEDVCAIMLELVQGEGGIRVMEPSFVRELQSLCTQRDWLILIDEVQSGVGRTGTLFAFQQYGILPDICSFAKGIAAGLPMGGILSGEKCRRVFTPGTHGTTFGANPVCAAAALAVQEILTEDFLVEVRAKGQYFQRELSRRRFPCFAQIRGLGLMVGADMREGYVNREIAARLIDHRLLVLTAGSGMRFMPPLTISREELDQALEIMEAVLR